MEIERGYEGDDKINKILPLDTACAPGNHAAGKIRRKREKIRPVRETDVKCDWYGRSAFARRHPRGEAKERPAAGAVAPNARDAEDATKRVSRHCARVASFAAYFPFQSDPVRGRSATEIGSNRLGTHVRRR